MREEGVKHFDRYSCGGNDVVTVTTMATPFVHACRAPSLKTPDAYAFTMMKKATTAQRSQIASPDAPAARKRT